MAMAFLAAAPTKALAVALFNFSIITPRGKHTSAACASVAHKQHGTVGTPRSLRACAVVTRQVPTRNACQRKVVFGKGQCFGNAGGALRVGSTGTARLQVRVVAAAAAHASSDAGNAHRPNAGNAHNTKQHSYKYSYGPLQSDPPLPRLAGALGSFSRIAAFIVAALLMLITRAKPSLAGAAQSVVNGVVEPVIVETVKTDSTGAVIGTVVLLVVYGFFAISETAITTLWPWKVREISDQEGPDSPFTLLRKDITRFLTTILIGSTFSSIGSAALATEAALGLYGEAGVGYVTIALTLVTLVMCEIAPKSYAVQHATQVARAVIRPIAAMSVLVYPLGRICTGLVNAFFKLMNIQGSAEPFVSEEELKLVLSGAAKSGQVDVGEQEMIQNVLDMGETPVREVMTPLVNVVGVEKHASLQDLRNLYRKHKYSRVPVYDDRVDNIVGVVNSMRMLDFENLDDASLKNTKISKLPGFGESPYFVPESMSVVKLMRELLARKTHMCIVVNEFGGTIGIATFEDCVEEIVGEIYDETDTPDECESNETFITAVGDGVYDVDYRCDVEDLADRVGVDIPRSALYDTVGGFTCDCFDHIPEVGETMLITLPIKASASSWDEIGGDDDGRGGTEHDQRSGSLGVDNGVYEKDADSQKNVEKDTRDTGYGMCPVRLTVTDGDQKMVRSVRVRVGDAALVENVVESSRLRLDFGLSVLTSRDDGQGSPRVSLDDGDAVDIGVDAKGKRLLPGDSTTLPVPR
mmetsp:Transcript_12937/g.48354  ORF Transcript_12937/g.48354 Transcript_12937/m.48354 type:complete len:751 (+) Transcript_12937:167-2419(+)